MYKKEKIVLIVCIFFSFVLLGKNKYVLAPRNVRAGLFSEFFAVLNHLEWCEKNDKSLVVYWDHYSVYYQPRGFNGVTNAWEYYFYPVSSQSYKKGDLISRAYRAPGNTCPLCMTSKAEFWCPNKKRRFRVSRIINKYIKLKPQVQKKIEDFYSTNMHGKKTIGIHYRGTDKKTEVRPVAQAEVIAVANKYAGQGYQFLVATDEMSFLEKAKKELNGKVVYYDCFRSNDGRPIWGRRAYSRAQVGEDVLIEVQLLSRCDKFIHTRSNVSAGVLCFNPRLESIVLGPPIRFNIMLGSQLVFVN